MTNKSPFHQGEIEIQKLAGEQAIASRLSKLIQHSIPTRALDFIRQQSIIWIGISGQENYPWAFPLFGSPGFINPRAGKRIEINLKDNFSIPDEWRNSLQKKKAIGCLVIDLSTRSRIRINGIINDVGNGHLTIDVQQAYPNCPKYIRKREYQGNASFCEFYTESKGIKLNENTKNIINRADTAFVASVGENSADVSHRGGESGFIKCHLPNKILVPDYKGNSMFNTLGNFRINPFGSLIITDFEHGYLLQISGRINLIFDKKLSKSDMGGTNRFWELDVYKWHLLQLKSDFIWKGLDFSPYNP